jgi:putative transposase
VQPTGRHDKVRDCKINGVTPEVEETSVTIVAMDVSAEPAGDFDELLVRQLVERARAEGLKLTGEGSLVARLTKVVVESALEGEMDDHLGYGKHAPRR